MQMMLDKKQIRVICLFKFKMGRIAMETTCHISSAQELLRDVHCSGGSRCLQRRWEPWSWGVRWPPSEVDSDQLRAVIRVDPLTTTWDVAKELSISHSVVIRHFKQIGKVKNLDKWMPHHLTENLKNRRLEVSPALMLCNSYEPFFDHIIVCDEKWILCNNWQQPAQWLDWEEAPKHFPKLNLHQKKS